MILELVLLQIDMVNREGRMVTRVELSKNLKWNLKEFKGKRLYKERKEKNKKKKKKQKQKQKKKQKR